MRLHVTVKDLDSGVESNIDLLTEAEGFYEEAISDLKKDLGPDAPLIVRAIAERIKGTVQTHLFRKPGQRANDAPPAPAPAALTSLQFDHLIGFLEDRFDDMTAKLTEVRVIDAVATEA